MALRIALAALAAVLVYGQALAGPPILCNPIEIAKARTLPMGSGPMEEDPGYSATKAVDDTVALLKAEPSPLVRMETMRRATLYVVKDEARAKELMSRLMAAALDALAADDKARATGAMFDAGFLAACYGEIGVDLGYKPGARESVQGYAWIKAALEQLPADAPVRGEMEFGAALATHPLQHTQPGVRELYDGHLKRATLSAKDGSLLAENIKRHHAKWDQYLKDEPKQEHK